MSTRIRLAGCEDVAGITAIYAPIVRNTHLSAEFVVPTIAEMHRRIVETLATHPWLVAEREGEIAGFTYGTRFRARPAYQWTAEVSVYIRADHHRRGLGRALYASLFECLLVQGFTQAIAVIALPNPPSVSLHESLGFVPVGVFPSVCFKSVAKPPPNAHGMDARKNSSDPSLEDGLWYDIGWWRLLLAGQPSPPPTLRTPSELAGTIEWNTAIATGMKKSE